MVNLKTKTNLPNKINKKMNFLLLIHLLFWIPTFKGLKALRGLSVVHELNWIPACAGMTKLRGNKKTIKNEY